MTERTHEQLWQITIKKKEDYQPYGEQDREVPDWGPDCSCGCKFFHQLEGKAGFDWGICSNPKSHRVGLLTFEHQGCRMFESEETNGNGEKK